METFTLLNIIAKGEDSTTQLKKTVTNPNDLAEEVVAFLNTNGGVIIVGINDKDSSIEGISEKELQDINGYISACSKDIIKPTPAIFTEIHLIDTKRVLIIEVQKGDNTPYQDKKGRIWVKQGADKRVASVEELRRLFQISGQFHADEMPINKTSIHDINPEIIDSLIYKKTNRVTSSLNISFKNVLENLSFLVTDELTLAGLLIAGNEPQKYCPLFTIHCICINGTEKTSNEFIDKENPFPGNIKEVFDQTIAFISRNIPKKQVDDSINSQAQWLVPKQVFEELIVNALLHRDYFINTTIKVMMFDDRIEIISPGKLPNSQTIEKLKLGSSVQRNPILVSNAIYFLPYLGMGTGIPRAINNYANIEFIEDKERELFTSIIHY